MFYRDKRDMGIISKQCQINIFNKQWTFSFSLYLISPYNVLSIPPYIYMYMYLPRLTFTVICTSKLPCIWVLWWAWSQICNQGESNSGNAGVFPMSIPPMVHSESCPKKSLCSFRTRLYMMYDLLKLYSNMYKFCWVFIPWQIDTTGKWRRIHCTCCPLDVWL